MLKKILDFLFPKVCVVTGTYGDYISTEGKKQLIPHPDMCPLSHRFSPDFVVLTSYKKQTAVQGIHICFYYTSYVKKLILKIKYFHQKDIINTIADRMFLSIQTNHTLRKALQTNACITYVPSHRRRKIFYKGYNQSELLAYALAKRIGIPCIPIVKKIRRTTSQTKLKRKQRLENIKNSFRIRTDTCRQQYDTIAIVDDIVTTGATIHEIASVIHNTSPTKQIWGIVVGRNPH